MPRINIGEIELNCFDSGEGTPFVFVHGFPLDHSMWEYQLDEFAQSHRVIAPDLRGFGQSDVTAGTVSMEQFADDVASLLDALNVTEPVVFCGLSMGGYIGWQFLARHRERVRALIQCDTRAIADGPEGVANREKLARLVLENGTEPVAAAMLPNLFAEAATPARQAAIQGTRQIVLRTNPAGIAAASLGMAARPDVTAGLPSLDVPTLLIVGEHDRISTVDEMQSIADAIPDAQFAVIPDAGHMSPLENPEAANSAIAEFLARLPQN
ncbi:MAG: alpha/beta fold hydrolase [Planctomycetota bacterium]|jgi:pimeloyl-ACP methyl ester carboxylesterase